MEALSSFYIHLLGNVMVRLTVFFLLIFFSLLVRGDESICSNLNITKGKPDFAEKAQFDIDKKEVILSFKKFSMGYEAGHYPEKKDLRIELFEGYIYESSYFKNGVENKMSKGYRFFDICEGKALVQYFQKHLSDKKTENYSEYFLIESSN